MLRNECSALKGDSCLQLLAIHFGLSARGRHWTNGAGSPRASRIAADTRRDLHPPSPCTSVTHVSQDSECRREEHTDQRGIEQRNDHLECAFAPQGPAERPAASTVLLVGLDCAHRLVGLGELQLYIQNARLPARNTERISTRAPRRSEALVASRGLIRTRLTSTPHWHEVPRHLFS